MIKTAISVEPILANNLNRAANGRRLCFELYGFDIILDHNLKPWLLEVNVLPSLSCSAELDKRIKTSLMSDIFNCIGIIPYNKKQLEKDNIQRNWMKFTGLEKNSIKYSYAVTEEAKEELGNDEEDWEHEEFSKNKIRTVKDLIAVKNHSEFNRDEQLVVVEFVEEYSRRGNFDLIFPRAANVDGYKKYFKVPRSCNTLVWRWLKMFGKQRQ